MKNLKKSLLAVGVVALGVAVYGFTTADEPTTPTVETVAPVAAPASSISLDNARLHRNLFLAENPEAASDFTFDYEQVKQFIEHIEYRKSQGEDVSKIRVYLSQYENGENTAFIAPIKEDGKPNYDIEVINIGQQGRPPGHY
ncbi:hypothetical protein [Gilvibacter sediminis]|uniref:hypothetical protein n=1 Tax=Gilvibacter sediminis TaxID=379071 RepID=UPI0023503321|nr:hypothetical protein [Gilvibacter sediminis]MDC7998002.1 hypothetical protein [Gilvibacter sediminis]